MMKFHQKYFIESIPFEDVNPNQIRQQNHKVRHIHKIENQLTRFQIYQETELACKHRTPLYKTQYFEILVEYEQDFDMNTRKIINDSYSTHHLPNEGTSYIPVNLLRNTGNTRGKIKPQDTDSTRLQELSLINKTCFWRNFL